MKPKTYFDMLALMNWSRIFLAIGALVFWGVRIYYWQITYEMPFSDMLDFENIANRVVQDFSFWHTPFWQSYKSPGLPALRAVQMVISGQSMLAWQIFLGLFTFLSLFFLVIEINNCTKRPFFGSALMWTIALSKPSIFWSYKIASEGPAEGFLYLSLACSLFSIRSRKATAYFLTGCAIMAGTLTRANFIILIPIALLVLGLFSFLRDYRRDRSSIFRSVTRNALIFLLGVMVMWGPWLVRGLTIYGSPVPLTTAGPGGFFWEIWETSVVLPDGREVKVGVPDYMASPSKFNHDCDANSFYSKLIWLWIKQHWEVYFRQVSKRILFAWMNQPGDSGLTRVSRDSLFPIPLMNRLLPDKLPIAVATGLLGLCLAPLFVTWILILVPLYTVFPFVIACFLGGSARFLEPSIPLLLFGNSFWVYTIYLGLRSFDPVNQKARNDDVSRHGRGRGTSVA